MPREENRRGLCVQCEPAAELAVHDLCAFVRLAYPHSRMRQPIFFANHSAAAFDTVDLFAIFTRSRMYHSPPSAQT